jgi:DNA-binding transcriptional MerR regulator
MADFTDTTTSLARRSGLAPETVRRYADLKLIDFRVASDGTRLFRAAVADRVRQIYASRIANRGRRPIR